MASVQECALQPRKFEHRDQNDQERRGRAAQSRVHQGQVSRARHVLELPLLPRTTRFFDLCKTRGFGTWQGALHLRKAGFLLATMTGVRGIATGTAFFRRVLPST